MTLHFMNVARDAESTKKQNYVILASLKSETMGKMINRMSTSVSKVLPGKLDIKRHSPSILYISTSLAMSTSALKALPGSISTDCMLGGQPNHV